MPSNQVAPGGATKTRIIHGAVSMVRAVPSREVSVIIVEIPDEHHVNATILVHGQHVLVMRSELENGTRYGVLDIAEVDLAPGPTNSGRELPSDTPAVHPLYVHAVVAMVRPYPSRAISALSLEVPESHHVEVTNLLHGRDAVLFPVKLPPQSPLGILKLGQASPSALQATGSTRRAPTNTLSSGADQSKPSSLLSRSGDQVNVTQWLGTKCATAQFQDFFGVRTEADAIKRVREICGVESRAHIRGNAFAMDAFRQHVFVPFVEHMKAHVEDADRSSSPSTSHQRDAHRR